jgi:hypothetical protein
MVTSQELTLSIMLGTRHILHHSDPIAPFTVTNCDENPQAGPITWLVGGAGEEWTPFLVPPLPTEKVTLIIKHFPPNHDGVPIREYCDNDPYEILRVIEKIYSAMNLQNGQMLVVPSSISEL